ELLEQAADLRELLGGRGLRGERAQHELRRRAAERPLEQIADELPLRPFLAHARGVNVAASRLVAPDEPLLRHDLQQLDDRHVADRGPPLERLVHFAHRGGAQAPEDAQDLELRVGRTRKSLSRHVLSLRRSHVSRGIVYDGIRRVNEYFRTYSRRT